MAEPVAAPWPDGVSVIMPVLNEQRHLSHAVTGILTQDWSGPLEIVLALGPSTDRTDEVARRLSISIKTVETHASSVLRKLQLSNRHELSRWAASRHIL